MGFVPGWSAKWRDHDCALPPRANGAVGVQTAEGSRRSLAPMAPSSKLEAGIGLPLGPVKRLEKKLFALSDRIESLARERAAVEAELSELREIAGESESDAIYYDEAIDRVDARLTAADVARFERVLADLDSERSQLEQRRVTLLDRL